MGIKCQSLTKELVSFMPSVSPQHTPTHSLTLVVSHITRPLINTSIEPIFPKYIKNHTEGMKALDSQNRSASLSTTPV